MTSAGGIEEDLIKCMGPVYVGDFSMSGKDLYKRGLNRSEQIWLNQNRDISELAEHP